VSLTPDVIEKLAIALGSSAVSVVAGYILAAARLKKTLIETVGLAKEGLSVELRTQLVTLKTEMQQDTLRLKNELMEEVDELKKEDLPKLRTELAREIQKVSIDTERQFQRVEGDVKKLEEKTEGVVRNSDFSRFDAEQTKRWEAMQRSLGVIEGQLRAASPKSR
jgi:hypothetical protein